MKVKDLIRELQLLDPELDCIMQGDAEGNNFSPLAGTDENSIYISETPWNGEVYDATWTAEEADMDDEDWQKILAKPRCVVLYPVN